MSHPGATASDRHKVVIIGYPEVVALGHEVLEPQAGPSVLDQIWRPLAEVLYPANLNIGGVHVDPVVLEAVLPGNYQSNGKKVPKAKPVGRFSDISGHRRVHCADQMGEGHRRDDVSCFPDDRPFGTQSLNFESPPARVADPSDRMGQQHG